MVGAGTICHLPFVPLHFISFLLFDFLDDYLTMEFCNGLLDVARINTFFSFYFVFAPASCTLLLTLFRFPLPACSYTDSGFMLGHCLKIAVWFMDVCIIVAS